MCCTQSGPELTACLILMEVSNPCLHSRAILKVCHSAPGISPVAATRLAVHRKDVRLWRPQELGWKDTALADINDVAFAITFFVCRILLGKHCKLSHTACLYEPMVCHQPTRCPSRPFRSVLHADQPSERSHRQGNLRRSHTARLMQTPPRALLLRETAPQKSRLHVLPWPSFEALCAAVTTVCTHRSAAASQYSLSAHIGFGGLSRYKFTRASQSSIETVTCQPSLLSYLQTGHTVGTRPAGHNVQEQKAENQTEMKRPAEGGRTMPGETVRMRPCSTRYSSMMKMYDRASDPVLLAPRKDCPKTLSNTYARLSLCVFCWQFCVVTAAIRCPATPRRRPTRRRRSKGDDDAWS